MPKCRELKSDDLIKISAKNILIKLTKNNKAVQLKSFFPGLKK
jgi:hypothetical protein